MRAYDGENFKDVDPKAIQEYRDDAGVGEGMDGSGRGRDVDIRWKMIALTTIVRCMVYCGANIGRLCTAGVNNIVGR